MRAPPGGANAAPSAAHGADSALRAAYALRGSPPPSALDWDDYDALIDALAAGLGNGPVMRRFTYEHPVRLQDPEAGVGKPYAVPLAFSDSGGRRRAPDRHRRADQCRPALRLPRPGRGAGTEGHRPGSCGSRGQWLARGAGRLSPGDLCRAAHAAHGLPRSRIVHPARLLSRRFRPQSGSRRAIPNASTGSCSTTAARTFRWNDGRAGQGRWLGTTCSAARPSCSAAPGRPRNTPDQRRTRSCSTAPITAPAGRMRKRAGSTGTTCEHFLPIEPRPDAASTCGVTGPR